MATLRRTVMRLSRLDWDSAVAPVVVAVGAEQVWPGSGILALGAALYLPVLIEAVRRPARRA